MACVAYAAYAVYIYVVYSVNAAYAACGGTITKGVLLRPAPYIDFFRSRVGFQDLVFKCKSRCFFRGRRFIDLSVWKSSNVSC